MDDQLMTYFNRTEKSHMFSIVLLKQSMATVYEWYSLLDTKCITGLFFLKKKEHHHLQKLEII